MDSNPHDPGNYHRLNADGSRSGDLLENTRECIDKSVSVRLKAKTGLARTITPPAREIQVESLVVAYAGVLGGAAFGRRRCSSCTRTRPALVLRVPEPIFCLLGAMLMVACVQETTVYIYTGLLSYLLSANALYCR